MSYSDKNQVQNFWDQLAKKNHQAAAIDPADRRGLKNEYIAHCRNRAIDQFLSTLSKESIRLLDYGCGTGVFLDWLERTYPNIESLGIDLSQEMLNVAVDIFPDLCANLIHYDGVSIPLDNDGLDIITTSGVLLYFTENSELTQTAAELFRVLKPGGHLLSVEQIRRNTKKFPEHKKIQRNPHELIELVNQSGFSLETWHPIRRGRFPLIYLIRYGIIPKQLLPKICDLEAQLWRNSDAPVIDYADALFVWRKPNFPNGQPTDEKYGNSSIPTAL